MTIANLLGCKIEMIETTGAIGAAKASGVAIGRYNSPEEAISTTKPIKTYAPDMSKNNQYMDAYNRWERDLNKLINE